MKKQIKKKYEDKLVVKANKIIEASYKLTLEEQKIILYMAGQIQPSDEVFKPIRLSLSEFADKETLSRSWPDSSAVLHHAIQVPSTDAGEGFFPVAPDSFSSEA